MGSVSRRCLLVLVALVAAFISVDSNPAIAETLNTSSSLNQPAIDFFTEYCTDCHNETKAKGKVNLEGLIEADTMGKDFKAWELIVEMLELHEMPPEDESQPSEENRTKLIQSLKKGLEHSKTLNSGDPGQVVFRRMTSAEYNYAIQDLTGLDLKLDRLISSDAVGGEGFTNVGEVQFVQDATIERYLEAAKMVAAHALIGSGPLNFSSNPGKTGQELSAIKRIQSIYRQHGFRTGAGEGAEAFGLDQYPKAFYVAWQHRYRASLKLQDVSLKELAQREGITLGFASHIWAVLNATDSSFPTSVIAKLWQEFPSPSDSGMTSLNREALIRQASESLYEQLAKWQKGLAANTKDDEEAAVLDDEGFIPTLEHRFRVGISWPQGASEASFDLAVMPACNSATEQQPIVHWENARFTIRGQKGQSGRRNPSKSLKSFLRPEQTKRMNFGAGPADTTVDPDTFITTGKTNLRVTIPIPTTSRSGFLSVTVRLDVDQGADCLVRCSVSDGLVEGETIASTGASAALLADPNSEQLNEWQHGISQFAQDLPQVSHREPAPSDRDPIPAPYDNTYNNAERNSFHYVIKYHRDDAFLTKHLISAKTRRALDAAWIDLLSAFDYHDTYFQFVAKKFSFDRQNQSIETLSEDLIRRIPIEPRSVVQRLHNHFQYSRNAIQEAAPDQLDDAIDFARKAWRRPIETNDEARLREFYWQQRQESSLDHPAALRALLARILVSPSFLYRTEALEQASKIAALTPLELASRLSFLIWSSIPDTPLIDAAVNDELANPIQLQAQVRRMLNDPKARRFATEFFGQWFGFYQFDKYQGIDHSRFPEFTEALKESMYDEAISFFEYIVRNDRPIHDLLFADYTFLNANLARHYQIQAPNSLESKLISHIPNVNKEHRGGLLQLGAILTTTSAPLRTSAVKRGDWILRRVLGTPVPPPPADAGSIPADDILADGLTVRARLEAHRTDPSCANCHSRIDPLGFALEHFDPVGRWRDTYRDGQTIDDEGQLSDGSTIDGIEGLLAYLRTNAPMFHRNLSSKLLGYALGRSVLVSDQALIDSLSATIDTETPLSELLLQIVMSQQFQKKRGLGSSEENGALETSDTLSNLSL